MKAWFLRFPLRDQIALLLLALVLGSYVLFMVLLKPLGQARADMENRNTATAVALQRVDRMVAQLRELRSSGGSGNASPAAASLTALLNESADRFQLPISRLQPNSRGAVQLRFEAVSLESLLRWLHQLESVENVAVEELSMTQTGVAGVVGANLRVAVRS